MSALSSFRRRLMAGAYPKEQPNYLCFTALEEGTFTFTMDTDVPSTSYEYIAYSKDEGNSWIRTDNVTGSQVIATVNVIEGDKVLWKGKATNGYSTSYNRGLSQTCRFGGTAKFNVDGCIVSLIRENHFVGFEDSEIVIIRLFQDSKIVEADKNLLPCKAFNSYERHYENTFINCTELISPPDLPSTKLRTGSYNSTFFGCSKLVNAPELPATTLSMQCYYYLFYRTKVNYVKMLGKTIGTQSLFGWMTNVPNVSTSIFVKHIDAAWTTTGNNGVPTNWTVIYYDPALDKYYTDQTRATECDDHGNPI